jgi:hypothetical protein
VLVASLQTPRKIEHRIGVVRRVGDRPDFSGFCKRTAQPPAIRVVDELNTGLTQ